jgi:3-oxo-4,17-pregnadiene-20-carboxyl-CoA hydratase beta subunit
VAELAATRSYDEVGVGDELTPLDVPLTRTLIASTAIATRDFQDVHHDPTLAQERGLPDIFMNILTTNGFVGRFVMEWAGPAARITKLSIRLGAPNHPGDTMRLTGSILAKDDETRSVTVALVGANSIGAHVTGTVEAVLP